MKKIIALLLVAIMTLGLMAGCGQTETPADPETPNAPVADEKVDDGKVYKLNVTFAAPEFSLEAITNSLNRIQEASNGRIEFTYYYSWSLATVATVVDDITGGVTDIAAVPVSEHLNLFPYSNLVTYTPFLGLPSQMAASVIYDELYNELPALQEEYSKLGLHYWTNYACPGYNFFTTEDNNIRTPDDLAGLKLISSSSMMSEFITAHGGGVVNSPVTEYATSLNTNVVDGVVNHANVVNAFGCMDFINGATVFGDSGTAISLMMMCMSEETWNELPADLQQLFIDEATTLRDEQVAWDYDANKANIEGLSAKGSNVVSLTDDEIKGWQDAFAPFLADYIDELVSTGSTDAQAVYDAVQAKIAAWE